MFHTDGKDAVSLAEVLGDTLCHNYSYFVPGSLSQEACALQLLERL